MFDCHKDVLAYHDKQVSLPQDERNEMRKRRDANRDRLKARLKDAGKPVPQEFIKQGSYAMLTMVQDADKDYDIDDGVYFDQEDIKKDDGTDMSPIEAKQMVCDALQDGRFNKKPQVKKNCVRVFYEEGYHVDMPIYRIRTADGKYELASDERWTASWAADVEDWFYTTNKNKSPDIGTNGGQFRRIVRFVKKFARSRTNWKEEVAAGFTITKLAEECYVANKDHEDAALRNCMQAMYDQLVQNLEVSHPVSPGKMLTSGPDDGATKFLRDKLKIALDDLKILDDAKCTGKQASKAWDKVFNTDFFSVRQAEAEKVEKAAQNSAALGNLITANSDPRLMEKKGGGRFA